MSDCAVLDTYQRAIENSLQPSSDDVEANEILHHIKSEVNEVWENVLGKKPTDTDRDWIIPETLVQIHEKQQIRKQFGSKPVEYISLLKAFVKSSAE